jgi:hypothetical protein
MDLSILKSVESSVYEFEIVSFFEFFPRRTEVLNCGSKGTFEYLIATLLSSDFRITSTAALRHRNSSPSHCLFLTLLYLHLFAIRTILLVLSYFREVCPGFLHIVLVHLY